MTAGIYGSEIVVMVDIINLTECDSRFICGERNTFTIWQ